MSPLMGDACTGAGSAEDARWARWVDRVHAHLDRLGWGRAQYEGRPVLQRLAWELYCDGLQPLVAAKWIRRMRA